MGNVQKKRLDKLKARQNDFDMIKGSTKAFKRPGSQNAKKQSAASYRSKLRRR